MENFQAMLSEDEIRLFLQGALMAGTLEFRVTPYPQGWWGVAARDELGAVRICKDVGIDLSQVRV